MSSLEDLIRFETANSGVAFRERAYAASEREDLLRDVVALANAEVKGPRFIVLGVRDMVGRGRSIVGVSQDQLAATKTNLLSMVSAFVEPPLSVDVRVLGLGEQRVGVICINHCDDPPYLFKETVCDTMPRGSGWVRRGTKQFLIGRADLVRMLEAKCQRPMQPPDIRIGFAGRLPQEEIALPVLPLDRLPSEIAGERLRKLLEAKKTAQDVLGATASHIERLVHAQVFGSDEVYEKHSADSLRLQLGKTQEEHRLADQHYQYELRAHKVDLAISNLGGGLLRSGLLVVTFPRLEGVGVSEMIYTDVRNGAAHADGYPTVAVGPHTVTVQGGINPVPQGATIRAFRQPLRLWLREPAAGKTLPVDYALHGASFSEPHTGTLRIHIVAAGARSS